MSIITSGEHKFTFVKKAGLWCETWFEVDRNNKAIQKQAWHTPEEYEKLIKEKV